MTKTNYLLCPGDACPLRFTCMRFQSWLNNEDEEAEEMQPSYSDGTCERYEIKDYYYGG